MLDMRDTKMKYTVQRHKEPAHPGDSFGQDERYRLLEPEKMLKVACLWQVFTDQCGNEE